MSEILINTTTRGVQLQPAVTPLGDERFFVVWVDGSDLNIKGRIIQANGNPSGGEFVVNTPTPTGANTNRKLPTVARSGRGPVVAWNEDALNPPGPRPHVKLRRFDMGGRPSGPEIQVSTTDVDTKDRPAINFMIDGGFLVSWIDARRDQRIRARRFDFDGSPEGEEFTVNTTEGFHEAPIATQLVDGNYVIAWRSGFGPPGGGALVFRIFDLEGSPVVGEITPNLSGFTGPKAMTLLDDGRFVIAHVRALGESDLGVPKNAVHANVFEPNGASANIPIFATGGQGEINTSSPTIASLPGGRFVLAWVQKRADTFATTPSVRARVFSASQGESVGQEVEVTTTIDNPSVNRSSVRAATLFAFGQSKTAFVAWHDNSQTGGDTSDFAVRGRVLPILPSGGLG
jgi:hypothetical protein